MLEITRSLSPVPTLPTGGDSRGLTGDFDDLEMSVTGPQGLQIRTLSMFFEVQLFLHPNNETTSTR